MTTAREIMTPGVECVRSSDTALDAARKMVDIDVGALPICGEDGKLKGMLTDRDIVVKVVAERKDPIGIHVGDLAQGVPVLVRADDDVQKVLTTMAQHRIRRVPVIDGDELVGIISQADVARAASAEQTGRVVGEISEG
ncbi:CBS domain-containing protein [Nocardia sp. NPDC127526]|uniref:CBS domain-containing protein n=1 Tax=Nocardia sp. NPDC127526 TaxID=3345393 RepID=UPI00363DAF68